MLNSLNRYKLFKERKIQIFILRRREILVGEVYEDIIDRTLCNPTHTCPNKPE
jgi:hypothetical protein